MERVSKLEEEVRSLSNAMGRAHSSKIVDQNRAQVEEEKCQHPATYVMMDHECRVCFRRRQKQKWVCPYCDGDHKDCSSS
jgi:hypothetical protein